MCGSSTNLSQVLKKLELEDRVQLYNNSFKQFSPLMFTKGWIIGVWMMGTDFQNKTRFYGAYPPSYWKRIKSLFPDFTTGNTLHLFSGSLPKETEGVRFDLVTDCDVKGDAHQLSTYFSSEQFGIVFADPPYSAEDAKRYGTPMVNRRKVIHECFKVIKQGGFLVWLDTVLPPFTKKEFKLVGTIAIVRSTNHRVRLCSVFRRVENVPSQQTEALSVVHPLP